MQARFKISYAVIFRVSGVEIISTKSRSIDADSQAQQISLLFTAPLMVY